jgi:flagellar protein FlbD
MIALTRLSGSVFALNPDLIERIDSTPDTIITLVDGSKYVVSESLRDVTEAVRLYRGSLLAVAAQMTESGDTDPRPRQQEQDTDAVVLPMPFREQ